MASQASAAGDAHQQIGRAHVDLEQELAEAHRREAATAEVLKAIGRSTFNLQDVLDSLIESAVQLTGADTGMITRQDGEVYRAAAIYAAASPEISEAAKQNPIPKDRRSATGRAVLERRIVHIHDASDDPEYTWVVTQTAGVRTILAVPMLREDGVIGVIICARLEVRPFTAKQIELVQTFADQAVIAIENTRLFEEVQARTAELSESLEYQTATSEVLSIISRAPNELQQVLTAVAESAARVCGASETTVFRLEGDEIHLAASFGKLSTTSPFTPGGIGSVLPLTRGSVSGRAIIERRTIHVADLAAEIATEFPDAAAAQTAKGHRTTLGAPLLRDGQAIGAIMMLRLEVAPFSEKQIKLLETFADQAVIAIENARLFEAEQASKRELQASLEYQTATSEVLNVISRSPTNAEPVFQAIAQSAARLCNAQFCRVFRFDGQLIHYTASHGPAPEELLRKVYPLPPGRESAVARAIASGNVESVPDTHADPDYHPGISTKFRSVTAVPMLKDGSPIGAIMVARIETGYFPEQQIELLKTFADQAVIAIENTRLFEEVQARTRELTESLEYQTAMSEVLGIISRSPNELQPVLDAMLQTAGRLCEAEYALFFRLQGGKYHVAGSNNAAAQLVKHLSEHPINLDRDSLVGRTALERHTVHLPDCLADPVYTRRDEQQIGKYRSMLGVPLLRDGDAIGVITLMRNMVKPFTQKQIELVTTFADQALIAIENTRLFEAEQTLTRELTERTRELAEALEYQTATSDVLAVISQSKFDLQPVLDAIAKTASRLCVADNVVIHLREDEHLRLTAHYGHTSTAFPKVFRQIGRDWVAGRTVVDREPVHVPDLQTAGDDFPLGRDIALRAGHRTTLGIPLLREDNAIGCFILRRPVVRPFSEKQIAILKTFADQAVIAIENTRLFDEIAQKSRELEIASQHKSQFVANMSHELRTPLAAVLGYAELLREGIYGTLPEKSLPILTRIRSNGQHLLGLINTVLDISKIEAGQFKLNVGEYALSSIVETVMVATESLAATKKLAFKTDVAKGLPYGLGDEQRLTQVLLNLVGNAIKFTDAGEVRITAGAANGHFELSVSDTGPGIPREERERIFEKFRQVDSSNTRAKGGTGLGLARLSHTM